MSIERHGWTGRDRAISVTVAICTWKRPQLLAQTLQRFFEVEVPADARCELLIVDNNSKDTTAAVVAEYSARLPIRYVLEERAGIACARNRALDESASSDYLLFTDDDVLVASGWMRAFVDFMQGHPEAAAVAGPIEPWFPEPPDHQLLDAFPVLAKGFCGIDEAQFVANGRASYTANLGFRTSLMSGLRFAEHLGRKGPFAGGGEDVTFCRALLARGEAIGWCPEMVVKHYVDPSRMTLPYLLQWHNDEARSRARVSDRPPGRTLLGVPLWAVRLWAMSTLTQYWFGFRGERLPMLKQQRARAQWAGTITEYFAKRFRKV